MPFALWASLAFALQLVACQAAAGSVVPPENAVNVKFVNAIPPPILQDNWQINIYTNETLLLGGLNYKEVSKYVALPLGIVRLAVMFTNHPKNGVIAFKTLHLYEPANATVFAFGHHTSDFPFNMLYLEDAPANSAPPNTMLLRFVSLAMAFDRFSVKLNSEVVFKNMSFGSSWNGGEYLVHAPGHFGVTIVNSNNLVIDYNSLTFNKRGIYTLFTTGTLGDPYTPVIVLQMMDN